MNHFTVAPASVEKQPAVATVPSFAVSREEYSHEECQKGPALLQQGKSTAEKPTCTRQADSGWKARTAQNDPALTKISGEKIALM
jgi:hypothetical protein